VAAPDSGALAEAQGDAAVDPTPPGGHLFIEGAAATKVQSVRRGQTGRRQASGLADEAAGAVAADPVGVEGESPAAADGDGVPSESPE